VTIDLDILLEYAGIRYAEGDHLAEAVLLDVSEGRSAEDIRDQAAASGAFLTAYFADCVARMQDAS
jgi:hypothetical protein